MMKRCKGRLLSSAENIFFVFFFAINFYTFF